MSEQSSLLDFGSGDPPQTDQYECGICGRSFDSTVGRGAYMPQTHDESEIRTELLAELQNLADELGRTPHQLDMDQQGGYGTKPYRAAFGSWTKTLDKIGLEHQTIRYPDHLGHKIRSTYEEEIADILLDEDVEYEYEPESSVFEYGNGRIYTPDFITDQYVIEVKGYVCDNEAEKAKIAIEQLTDKQYVVVQNNGERLPADRHIQWDEREKLRQLL